MTYTKISPRLAIMLHYFLTSFEHFVQKLQGFIVPIVYDLKPTPITNVHMVYIFIINMKIECKIYRCLVLVVLYLDKC